MTWRDSWIVRLEVDGAGVGTGEAAPLAGHGLPDGPPVNALLQHLQDSLPCPLDALPLPRGMTASEAAVRFAVETASLDLVGRANSQPVASLLGARRTTVEVNAVIDAVGAAEVASRAAAAVHAGFGTIKLKVGGRPLAEEVQRVAHVRRAIGPSVRLRLDANGAWSVAEATAALSALHDFDLELVEQPIAAGQLGALRRVRETSGVPIAADEDVVSPAAAHALVAAGAVDYLVLKPMMLGGFATSLDIARRAEAAQARCYVTTTIDTGVATAAALHLSAALPGTPPACGLATTSLLETDLLVEPLEVRSGVMQVPARPGLGVEVDGAAMARLAKDDPS